MILFNNLAYQTNLYSTQQTGKSNCVTQSEIEQFIGINMHMGVIKMTNY